MARLQGPARATSGRRRGTRGRDQSLYLLFGLLLLSVVFIGAAHRLTVVALAVALAGVGVWWVRTENTTRSPLALAFLGCGLWTLVAVVPLPLELVQFLSPNAGEMWGTALKPWGAPSPAWVTLSLDPGASWLEGLKWFAYVVVASLSAEATRKRGLNAVLLCVFIVAVFLAVVSLLQAVFQFDSVLGLYQPHSRGPRPGVSLLVNPNNLAGYLNLGGFCGLGLIASRRPPGSRAMIALGVCLCLASSVWSGSRGGVAALAILLFVLAVIWLPRLFSKSETSSGARVGVVLLVAMGLPALSFVGATPALYREIFSDDLSKLEHVPLLLPAVKDFWLTGVGRGGFESVSQMYLPSGSNVAYRYVENFLGSWLIEWGVPFTLLLCAWLGFLLRPKLLGLRHSAAAQVAYAGVIAVLLQNLADLGLELFSLAAATLTVGSALIASSKDRGVVPVSKLDRGGSWLLRLSVGCLGLAIVGTLLTGPDAYQTRDRFSSVWGSEPHAEKFLTEMQVKLQAEVVKRPADPYPFILGSMVALELQKPAFPWAASALRRAPSNGRAHLAVALSLEQRGAKKQALYHLVQAIRFDRSLATYVGQRAARLSDDAYFYTSSVAPDRAGAELLLGVAALWSSTPKANGRRALIEKAAEVAPHFLNAQSTLAHDLLFRVAERDRACLKPQPAQDCAHSSRERAEILGRIHLLSARMQKIDPCAALQLRARVKEVEGDVEDAVHLLEQCSSCTSPVHCLKLRVSIAQKIADIKLRQEIMQAYLALACDTFESCAHEEHWVGTLAEGRGEWLGAYAQYSRAASRVHKGEYWLAAARTAARAGLTFEAERAYKEAVSLGVSDQVVKAAVDAARRESVRQLLTP